MTPFFRRAVPKSYPEPIVFYKSPDRPKNGVDVDYTDNAEYFRDLARNYSELNTDEWNHKFPNGIPPCNLYRHGVCVTFMYSKFKWNHQHKCLPACHSFSYKIRSVYVSIANLLYIQIKHGC